MKNSFIRVAALSVLVPVTALGALVCPESGHAPGDQPALLVRADAGHRLLVCGAAEGVEKKAYFSEFDIYSEKAGKISPSLLKVSALEHYRIKHESKKLSLEEHITVQDQKYPAFQSTIECTNSGCKQTEPVCIYKAPTPAGTKVLKTIESYVSGSQKGMAPDETLIEELSDLALSGNRKAAEIFINNPGLQLDGASAEAFTSTAQLIKRLRQGKCLK